MKQDAFTLIEILVALSLVALITAVVIPETAKVFNTDSPTFARESAVFNREARDHAVLFNKIVRIRYDLDQQSYWTEAAPSSYILPKTAKAQKRTKEKKEQGSPFALIKEINKKKKSVPNGVKIVGVIVPRQREVIKDGVADVHFFPHGAAESAIIHLEDSDASKMSLILHPITGKTKIESGFKDPRSVR